MDYPNDRRDEYYDDNTVNQTPWQSYTEPMRTPCRRKGHGWIVLVAVLIVALAAAIGIWRWVQDYSVQLERTPDGVTLRLQERSADTAESEPAQTTEAEAPEEASAAPKTQSAAQADLHSDTELTLQAGHAGAPTASSNDEDALSLQEIYEKMIPSVVSIVTNAGTGTGIVMSEDGYLITNCHVIAQAQQITAMTWDETTYTAALVGSDEASDLAVLKIEPDEALTAAEFGDSDALRVGDTVVAIGDPLGVKLRGTMTNGIVSAINRNLMVNDREMTLIQTNAALNNGNSGGPLINCYGQVVGVNAVKLSSYYSQATVEGLGFAIPISTAKPIIDELIQNGYVAGRPAIGISGEQLPAAARVYYGLPEGVYVTYVAPDSGAWEAGVRKGDIITAINGTAVSSVDALNTVKNRYSAGDTVTLTIYRSGQTADVDITLMDEALQTEQ